VLPWLGPQSWGNGSALVAQVEWEQGFERLGQMLFQDVELVRDTRQAMEAWHANGTIYW